MAFPKLVHIIIGNGVAGITAASELARRQAGEIIVYSQEPYHYYFRPRLPFFIAGETSLEELFVHPPSWYEKRGIRVHLNTRVDRILPDRKRIVLHDGTEIAYDRLLLATGSRPFIPPVEGSDGEGIFTLRTLEDAIAIREYASRCEKAIVVGGGLLGLEVARGLQTLGLEVTVLERGPYPLPRQLDPEGAAIFRQLIEDMGIKILTNASIVAIARNRKVHGVRLEDGRELSTDMVLIAAGVRCNSELAAAAGILVDRGIVVDERMRTSAPDIFAAGDVASFNGRSWGIIPVAREQARVAAANMAGEEATYREVVPSNTLKIVGIDLTSVGLTNPGEGFTQLKSADPERGVYKKLVLKGEIPVGAIVIGDRALARRLETIVSSGSPLSLEEARELLGVRD